VAPFALKDEFYYNMKMREDDRRRVPILNIAVPGEVAPQTVAWAVQRAGGGRGFAFTGGHSHANWRNDELRKLILNAIVWTAHGAVPKMGVRSEVAADG
jgi:type 1 glutamine amidotransferase